MTWHIHRLPVWKRDSKSGHIPGDPGFALGYMQNRVCQRSSCRYSPAGTGRTAFVKTDTRRQKDAAHPWQSAPADDTEVYAAVKAAIEHEGPVYMRFSRAASPVIYDPADLKFEIGKGITVRDGKDITIKQLLHMQSGLRRDYVTEET